MSTSNGYDPTIVQQFVKDIERHFATLESYRGEYMNRCKSVRELITRSKDAAKEEGIPKKLLNALLKERELERKIDNIHDSFEDEEDADNYEALKDALGSLADTPLGKAALGESDDADLRPRHLKEAEAQRVEENKRRLKEGIKGLPGGDATEA